MMSAWSGIRPLATDPDAADTASASRDHVVSMDNDGMITIAGLHPTLLYMTALYHSFAVYTVVRQLLFAVTVDAHDSTF